VDVDVELEVDVMVAKAVALREGVELELPEEDDETRNVELPGFKDPSELVAFVLDVGVDVVLLVLVELVGDKTLTVLFEEAEAVLAFIEVEDEVMVALKTDALVILIEEEFEAIIVAFRREVVVEIAEELLEGEVEELRLIEGVLVMFIEVEVDAREVMFEAEVCDMNEDIVPFIEVDALKV
jgi:hypothetical protein